MEPSKNLSFNYLSAGQIQKHLTVNDALAKLDACAQWVVSSPTQLGDDGSLSLAENHRDLVIWLNGGYETVLPKMGWRAYFVDEGVEKVFDGAKWQAMRADIVKKYQFDIDLASTTRPIIPQKTLVFAISARVQTAIEGANLTGWKLGIAGDENRYGAGLWLGKNGWSSQPTSNPILYWSDTEILVTGEGGAITSGALTIWVYGMEFAAPDEFD